MFKPIVALVSLLAVPLAALAQPLSDRVPADALIYAGWQGTDAMPAAYQQSHLKQLVDASGVADILTQTIPALLQRATQENKQDGEHLTMAWEIIQPMLRHPTAFYFSGVEVQPQPHPKFAILCDAGNDSQPLLDKLTNLLAQAHVEQAPFPIKAFKNGNVVALSVGYPQETDAMAGGAAGPKSISTSGAFKDAMGQVHKEPVAIVYLDSEAGIALFEKLLAMNNDVNAAQKWGLARDALGIGGLKRLIWTAGFEGKDWAEQCFISAPGPRVGLLKLLDSRPASKEILQTIPETATWAQVGHLNLAAVANEVRESAGKIDPQAQKMFDMGMGAAQMATAVNIQKELFESLGDEWAFYADPTVGGRGPLNLVMVNKLAKPEDAKRAFDKLELFTDNMINAQLQREKMTLSFKQIKSGDVTIHTVTLPGAAPSWAVSNGNLYVALYPQLLVDAVARGPGSKSILDNPKYQSVRQRLNVENAAGVGFADVQEGAAENYQALLLLPQILTGFSELVGAPAPVMIVPPLNKLQAMLSPAGNVSWTDDLGFHSKSIAPFPCAALLNSQASVVGGIAMIGGISMPALFKARERADRVRSASNMRQIGQGMMLYANEHKGRYPADLSALLLEEDLPAQVFVSKTPVPQEVLNARPADKAAWVVNNSDFVYLGSNLTTAAGADKILAYEKPELNQGEGMNILFGDGHVEWWRVEAAMPMIQKQLK